MASTPPTALVTLPSAFAAACRLSRTEGELFERCRVALVRRFQSELIWLTLVSPDASSCRGSGRPRGSRARQEVARLGSGETEVVIHADPSVAGEMRAVAMPLALGLSVVLELRSILLERQAALDDAVFQLRALRQVARLLSSVHSIEDTEQLILDFMAEVFFAWWACLYRPEGDSYAPKVFRSLNDRLRPGADRQGRAGPRPPARERGHRRGRRGRGEPDRPGRRAGGAARRRRRADGGAGARLADQRQALRPGRARAGRHAVVRRRHRAQELRAGRAAPQRRHHRRAHRARTTAARSRSGWPRRSRAACATSSTPACC